MAKLIKTSKNQIENKTETNDSNAQLEDTPVYVRYKDHVLFKNLQEPAAEAVERETVGWLTKQNDEIILVEHDRTVQNEQLPCGEGNGLILLKNCILEIQALPLQKNSNWYLNSQEPKLKDEYALKPKKRKTQTKRTGANK